MFKILFRAQAYFINSNIDVSLVNKEIFFVNFWKNKKKVTYVEPPRQLDQQIFFVSDLGPAYKVWLFVQAIYIPDLEDTHHHARFALDISICRLYLD